MTTSQKQTSPLGGEKLQCLQEASPASLSASRDEERERTMTATSGRRCFGQFGRYSPLGSLAKMLLESEAWYSPARRLKWQAEECYSERITLYEQESGLPLEKSAEVLSVRDIPSRRLLFRLVPSVRPTGATGCGLLPTPVEIDTGSGRTNRSLSPNATPRPTLARAARENLFPTPTVMEDRRKPNGSERDRKLMTNLNPFSVANLLLTPQASDGLRSGMRMETLVKAKENGDLAQQVAHRIGGGSSQLNPLFVEEMMGFPTGWTLSPFLYGEWKA